MTEGDMRPFNEQTTLERALRAHLPTEEYLERISCLMKNEVRKQNHQKAADFQATLAKGRLAREDWGHLLDLYEAEFRARK